MAGKKLSLNQRQNFTHLEGLCTRGGGRSAKNLLGTIVLISLALLVGACEKEEGPKTHTPRVVVPIKKPAEKTPFTPVAQEEAEQEKSVSSKTAALPELHVSPPAPEEKSKTQLAVESEGGYYTVKKGDTLFKIAGRKDVYGDPMKWPGLFRLNIERLGEMKVAKDFHLKWSSVFQFSMNKLGGMKVVENFPHEELPEGLALRFLTPDEVQKNLAEMATKEWVVNVLSSHTSKKLVPSAIMLMKEGYRVYIARATVKGEEWMRLRVGFFEDRADAAAVGKKIISSLNTDDVWVARIGKEERAEFWGH